MMGVIGGTLTGPLIFILPPLFYTKMLQLERIHDDEEQTALMDEQHLNDTELLIKSHYGAVQLSPQPTKYATELIKRVRKIARSECTLSIIVIIFGICATFASTYYNIVDFKGFKFWSPCIQNISLSYELLSL